MERFGRYVIEGLLGEGGMGRVYRAVDPALRRAVALKVVQPDLLAGDGLERLRREARAAAAVLDPHVTTIYHLEQHGPAVALVMELVPGGSLRDRLKREGRLDWREACALGADVARGLAALHAAGLVHRDVKPANVLLTEQGRAKLTDLGLVRPTDASRSLTATGVLVGTFEYLAPEQQGESSGMGPAIDLYALGATLFHLVAGRPPFEGQGVSLLKKHALDAPPRLRALAPGAPPGLDALVDRLLSKDPAARGRAADVAAELQRLATLQERARGPDRRPVVVAGLAAGLALALAGVAVAVALARRPAGTASPVTTPPPSTSPRTGTTPTVTPPAPVPVEAARAPRLQLRLVRTFRVPEFSLVLGELSLDRSDRWLALGGSWNRPFTAIVDPRAADPGQVLLSYPLAGGVWSDTEDRTLYAVTVEGRLQRFVDVDPASPDPGTGSWPAAVHVNDGGHRLNADAVAFDPGQGVPRRHNAGVLDLGPEHVLVTLDSRPDPVVVVTRDGRVVHRFHDLASSADTRRSAVVNPRSRRLYLSRTRHQADPKGSRFVAEVALDGFEVLRELDDFGVAGADPDSGRVFLVGEDFLLAVLPPPSSSRDRPALVRSRQAVGHMHQLVVRRAPWGQTLLALPAAAGKLTVLDADTLEALAELAVPLEVGSVAMAMDRAATRLYAAFHPSGTEPALATTIVEVALERE